MLLEMLDGPRKGAIVEAPFDVAQRLIGESRARDLRENSALLAVVEPSVTRAPLEIPGLKQAEQTTARAARFLPPQPRKGR
jgi:hypothetical protein